MCIKCEWWCGRCISMCFCAAAHSLLYLDLFLIHSFSRWTHFSCIARHHTAEFFFLFFDLRPPHYFYLSMARPEGDTLPLRHSLISLLVLTWLSPQTCLLKAFRAVYLNQNDFFDTNAASPKILISITSVYRSNYNLQFVWLFSFLLSTKVSFSEV